VAAAAFNGMSVEKRLAEKAVSKDVRGLPGSSGAVGGGSVFHSGPFIDDNQVFTFGM